MLNAVNSFSPRSRRYFLLVLIIILAAFLRLTFFTGSRTHGFDAFFYWDSAALVTKIGISNMSEYLPLAFNRIKGWFSLKGYRIRFSFILPHALFFYLFGISELTANLWPLLCSLGEIVLVFYLGRFLFDEDVGLLSAFLIAINPHHIVFSTYVGIDTTIAFFFALAVFFFLKGIKEENWKIFHYSFSGIFIFVAYAAKAYGPLIFIVLFCFVIFFKKFEKYQFLTLFSFLFLISLLFLHYYLVLGDFFFHIHDLKRYTVHSSSYIFFFTLNLFPILTGNGVINEAGFFPYFILLATIVLLFKKDKATYPAIIWLLVLFLYFELGSMSLTTYRMMTKMPRYLSIITTPSTLILAQFLTLLYRKKIFFGPQRLKYHRSFPVFIVTFLLVTSIYSAKTTCFERQKIYKDFFFKINKVGSYFVSLRSNKPINLYYIPSLSWRIRLPYELRFGDNFNLIDFADIKDYKKIKNAYIVIDEQLLKKGKVHYDFINVQKYSNLLNIPEHWMKVYDADKVQIYHAPG